MNGNLTIEIRENGELVEVKDLPVALAKVQRELRERGEDIDVVGCRAVVHRDEESGLYTRLIFELSDGSMFVVDTNELDDEIRKTMN